jgi:hypothetical protein
MDKISGHLVFQLWGMWPISETDFVIGNMRIVKLHGRGVNS